MLTIGVDIGGTKVAAGVVDPEGQILDKVKYPTPSNDPQALADVVARAVGELRGRQDADSVRAVGVGVAGFVDEDRATVQVAVNLGLRDEPLRDHVQERVGLPVVIENDANAAAWAEARFGAGRGSDHIVCITLGTGIGGGLVIGGALHRGRYGVAAEVGHYRMVPHGRRCACGNHGCWEQYASGRALVAEAQDLALTDPVAAERMLKLADGVIDQVEGHVITQAALEGDRAALECFAKVGEWAGHGLADLAAILDPECFVLGGGVSDAGSILLDPVRAAFARNVPGRPGRRMAEVRLAELGGEAGIVGAGDLARH
ncbi:MULTISPECIES: ROK family glucokinase [Nocardiopsis]|jgi:glucokinase|uniref:Glucokinase n=2 Tax=Nocardiopsis TaxID=2013 RepID=D7B281_NOCDD|nr:MULTISPECIES: ROK family glucokinase [Nocardiopsis]ADH68538.1 glucokinase, ROK family [Nocardiopsis dassonvillei subsp. dassonvillei DSM 43111]APC36617.1 glucokinase [Nocardiopsis dassonvillei]ASU59550.1 glucokinase [Nocardiopsis dassonvillei]MCP3013528.1 ROK family glucokinase [Nocardiopsis dassonvillei]NKY80915.1 ROK family glucokinase [Nocardiopsis dassonvillei]